jgi:inhibitor of KinA
LNKEIKIFPIGDSAATVELGNCIDDEINQKILSINEWLSKNPFNGMKDIIIAYSSLSVFYDPCAVKNNYPDYSTAFECVKNKLEEAYSNSSNNNIASQKEIIRIPVCYDDKFGCDLDFVATEKNISKQEVIELHGSVTYKVYMVGFLPGFAYMGKLDEKLIVPRKLRPEQVVAGSVGITGSQTAIYPMNCPGGWHIIGRTPVKLFNADAEIPIKLTLDTNVQFYPISTEEFENTNWQ